MCRSSGGAASRAARGDHAGAIADFEAAARKSSVPFREWAALAELLSLVGRDARQRVRAAGRRTRPRGDSPRNARSFARPFSAARLRRAPGDGDHEHRGRADGSRAPQGGGGALLEVDRDRSLSHLAHTNLGIVLAAQGRSDEALSAHDRAVALAHRRHASPYYWRGRYFAARKDWPSAAPRLRGPPSSEAPSSWRELAALARDSAARRGERRRRRRPWRAASWAIRDAFERERRDFAANVLRHGLIAARRTLASRDVLGASRVGVRSSRSTRRATC
jgi:tetratricopeptide (TPR) repeat protein